MQSPSTSTSSTHSATLDPALILVVDDEPQIVDFLSILLEGEGYRVRKAHNGREAKALIEEEGPWLVISDVMMPESNGVDLLRYIDASRNEAPPKVILMSAVAERAIAPGVPFIQKPFDIDDLLELIDGILESPVHQFA